MILEREHGSVHTNVVGTRRSKMIIIADILRHAPSPTKKIQIMCECNLSFNSSTCIEPILKEVQKLRFTLGCIVF